MKATYTKQDSTGVLRLYDQEDIGDNPPYVAVASARICGEYAEIFACHGDLNGRGAFAMLQPLLEAGVKSVSIQREPHRRVPCAKFIGIVHGLSVWVVDLTNPKVIDLINRASQEA